MDAWAGRRNRHYQESRHVNGANTRNCAKERDDYNVLTGPNPRDNGDNDTHAEVTLDRYFRHDYGHRRALIVR